MDDPTLPTQHGVGSEAKVELLARRYELGLPLHVEGDAMRCDKPPELRGRVGTRTIRGVNQPPQTAPRTVRAYSLRLPFYRGASD